MRRVLQCLSFAGLALVIGPVLAYVTGSMDKGMMSNVMLAGTILWFASVPFWMGRSSDSGPA